jgi:hypothetical protein
MTSVAIKLEQHDGLRNQPARSAASIQGEGGGRSFTFDIYANDLRQPDDSPNSSKDNRYLTVFLASRPDGDLNVPAECN